MKELNTVQKIVL